jgi:hypothetical protein
LDVPYHWQPKGEIVAREIAGETILVPVRNRVGDLDSIFTLNEVGAFVWGLIGARASGSHIAGAIATEFDVSPAEAERDALEFIASLEAAGLVEPCSQNR